MSSISVDTRVTATTILRLAFVNVCTGFSVFLEFISWDAQTAEEAWIVLAYLGATSVLNCTFVDIDTFLPICCKLVAFLARAHSDIVFQIVLANLITTTVLSTAGVNWRFLETFACWTVSEQSLLAALFLVVHGIGVCGAAVRRNNLVEEAVVSHCVEFTDSTSLVVEGFTFRLINAVPHADTKIVDLGGAKDVPGETAWCFHRPTVLLFDTCLSIFTHDESLWWTFALITSRCVLTDVTTTSIVDQTFVDVIALVFIGVQHKSFVTLAEVGSWFVDTCVITSTVVPRTLVVVDTSFLLEITEDPSWFTFAVVGTDGIDTQLVATALVVETLVDISASLVITLEFESIFAGALVGSRSVGTDLTTTSVRNLALINIDTTLSVRCK